MINLFHLWYKGQNGYQWVMYLCISHFSLVTWISHVMVQTTKSKPTYFLHFREFTQQNQSLQQVKPEHQIFVKCDAKHSLEYCLIMVKLIHLFHFNVEIYYSLAKVYFGNRIIREEIIRSYCLLQFWHSDCLVLVNMDLLSHMGTTSRR